MPHERRAQTVPRKSLLLHGMFSRAGRRKTLRQDLPGVGGALPRAVKRGFGGLKKGACQRSGHWWPFAEIECVTRPTRGLTKGEGLRAAGLDGSARGRTRSSAQRKRAPPGATIPLGARLIRIVAKYRLPPAAPLHSRLPCRLCPCRS